MYVELTQEMQLSSTGMVCPVGLNAVATCAALRAGITGFVELPYFHTRGELVMGAKVPGLAADFENPDRLVEMLALAVADCLRNRPAEPLESIPLLVGLAEPERPGGGAGLADSVIPRVEGQARGTFPPQPVGRVPEGAHRRLRGAADCPGTFSERGCPGVPGLRRRFLYPRRFAILARTTLAAEDWRQLGWCDPRRGRSRRSGAAFRTV